MICLIEDLFVGHEAEIWDNWPKKAHETKPIELWHSTTKLKHDLVALFNSDPQFYFGHHLIL